MKKVIFAILFAVGTLTLLAGCAKDNTPPPMPLAQVAPKLISVETNWQTRAGNGTDGQYFNLGAAVVGNTAYVADADGDVTALNTNTGQQLWQTDTKAPISATAAVGAGKVFVGTLDGKLIALDSGTGKQLWQTDLTSSLLSPPAVGDGMVIVHTHDGNVAGFDINTGKRVWLFNGSTPTITLEGDSSPAISGNVAVVGFANGQVAAFQVKSGKLLWQRPVALPRGSNPIANMVDIDSTAVIMGNTVYVVAYQGDLVALDLTSGKLLWQHPISAFRNIAVGDGKIFVTSASGQIWAFDQGTGQQVWVQNNLQHRYVSAPAVVDGQYIVVGDYAGYVHFLSIRNGALLARKQVGDQAVRAQPVAMGNGVIVVTTSGRTTMLTPGDV